VPRPCTICTHPRRVEIDRALLDGESYPTIAKRFGVSAGALGRHKRSGHVEEFIAQAKRAGVLADAESLRARLEDLFEQTEQDSVIARAVLQALLEWLDIDVELQNGKAVPRSANGSRVRPVDEEGKPHPVIVVKTGPKGGKALVFAGKHVLECVESLRRYSDTMTRQLETIARVVKVIEDRGDTNINILYAPQWLALRTEIREVLTPFPAAKKALFEMLRSHGPGDG